MALLLLVVFLLCCCVLVEGSNGDNSFVFNKCVYQCKQSYCAAISDKDYTAKQPISEWLIGWKCPDECEYTCMWSTVEAFRKDGSGVPQFHGKWPFIRVFGIQEPASVLFSVLNGLAHLAMIYQLRRLVPQSAPMYWIWHLYALVCAHAWFWSVIFHTKDTPFTEKMDYFCAFSLVTFNLFTLCARMVGTHRPLEVAAIFVAIAGLYGYHVHYLTFVKFDYGYNMTVNIAVALSSCGGWILWAFKVMKQQPYAKKMVLMMTLFMACAALEVLDFPPLWWTLDPHSLWHAGTAPLCILWYSFVIDDCLYLEKHRKSDMISKNNSKDSEKQSSHMEGQINQTQGRMKKNS